MTTTRETISGMQVTNFAAADGVPSSTWVHYPRERFRSAIDALASNYTEHQRLMTTAFVARDGSLMLITWYHYGIGGSFDIYTTDPL